MFCHTIVTATGKKISHIVTKCEHGGCGDGDDDSPQLQIWVANICHPSRKCSLSAINSIIHQPSKYLLIWQLSLNFPRAFCYEINSNGMSGESMHVMAITGTFHGKNRSIYLQLIYYEQDENNSFLLFSQN